MPVDPRTRRVIDTYRQRTERLRQQLTRYLTASWYALEDYRTPDIERFVGTVVPVVEGSLRQMVSLTDGYLAAVETTETGERTRPVGAPTVSVETLRGVDASEVYARGGTALWTALSAGTAFPQALDQAANRLANIGQTDLQLAKTHTTRAILADKRHVSGYRRVLEGRQSCGMCVVASTQRYRRGDLMPIHGGCDCSVLPIFGEDPGRIINQDVLDDVHDRIAERFGADVVDQTRKTADRIPRYQDVLVTHEHGEIGPVLARKGDQFTGPNDL